MTAADLRELSYSTPYSYWVFSGFKRNSHNRKHKRVLGIIKEGINLSIASEKRSSFISSAGRAAAGGDFVWLRKLYYILSKWRGGPLGEAVQKKQRVIYRIKTFPNYFYIVNYFLPP